MGPAWTLTNIESKLGTESSGPELGEAGHKPQIPNFFPRLILYVSSHEV